MLLELRQLSVPPGQRVLLHDVSWQELEQSQTAGRNVTLKAFRQWVRTLI